MLHVARIDFSMVQSADISLGSACYTNEEDEHNPMSYNLHEGTPGFKPPELWTMSDPVTKRYKEFRKLGSATNIWSVGASLISICNRDTRPQTDFLKPETSIPTFNANAHHVYSPELRNLLAECVRYKPEERITAQHLRDEISQYTAGADADPDADLADGMRAGRPDRTEWSWPVKERYRLDFSHDDGEKARLGEVQREAEKDQKEMQEKKAAAADAAKAKKEAAKAAKAEKAAAAKAKRAAAAAAKKGKTGKT